MFGWFKKKSAKPASQGQWTVEFDGHSIRATDPDGASSELAVADLAGVMIRTTDTGPWGADVWWLLFGADDKLAIALPQGAAGEQAVVDYLSALPGFDHDEMINAMQSTDNNVFPVWRLAR